ncbi:MAG: CoA pyrophosphatase [Polyangiaceae bacterium]|nr:CoA pyrophosphatase [Polyangiaceae bacterium]
MTADSLSYHFDGVVARLRAHRAADVGETADAAVATVLRPGPAGAEVLYIKRAEREGDPWSGHVAFPGGMRAPVDATLFDTARRETVEEVGLDLDAASFIVCLGEVSAIRNRVRAVQFVFAMGFTPPLTLSREVAATLWVPLEHAAALDASRPAVELPSLQFGSYLVWGMTYRMTRRLLEAVRG